MAHTAVAAPAAAPQEADCTWCGKEVALLHQKSGFAPEVIEAYALFYRIFGGEYSSLQEVAKRVKLSEEDTELSIVDARDWLVANSPFRSLPPRCWVCDHAWGPKDMKYLREPKTVS